VVVGVDCFKGGVLDVERKVDAVGVEVAVDELPAVSEVPVLQAE
jgi:hypothetical protein